MAASAGGYRRYALTARDLYMLSFIRTMQQRRLLLQLNLLLMVLWF